MTTQTFEKFWNGMNDVVCYGEECHKAVAYNAWQAALSQPNAPVAWRYRYVDKGSFNHSSTKPDVDILDDMRKEYPQFYIEPLYSTPPNLEARHERDCEQFQDSLKAITELTAKCEQMREALNKSVDCMQTSPVVDKYVFKIFEAIKSAKKALEECK